MDSRERMLKTFAREETDYTPCLLRFYASKCPNADGYRWKDRVEKVKIEKKMGVDSEFMVGLGTKVHPEVKTKVWEEKVKGEDYPILHKEYLTPAGKLTASVKKTEDWPHGNDIPVMSDFNVSRYVKPLIETKEDVEKLPYLLYFDKNALPEWEKEFMKAKATAQEEKIILAGNTWDAWYGMESLMWFCGAEKAILLAVEEPETVKAMLSVVHKSAMETMKVVLEHGVDVIFRRGWYESTDFWSPKMFKEYAMQNLKEEINLTHNYNTKFAYIMCTGIMPLLPVFKGLDFDILDAIEPVLGNQDLGAIKRELGDKKCFITGVSAPISIEMGDENKVRKAVRDAFEIFGHKGFILNAVPSIRPHWPWNNVLTMVDEWKKLRKK